MMLSPLDFTRLFQRRAGLVEDGIPGDRTIAKLDAVYPPPPPFDRAAFLARFVNLHAPAISEADLEMVAERLNVPVGHIRAVQDVESRGSGFDREGRPTILFEPHIFHRRTDGKYSPSSFSYPNWKDRPYPKSMDGRWEQMADAAERDESAALESASWGAFQIMGWHWLALGYASAQDFAAQMAASAGNHLDAMARYIEANGLADDLRRCTAGDPDSCRDFARGYNGKGYAANNYHGKIARAL